MKRNRDLQVTGLLLVVMFKSVALRTEGRLRAAGRRNERGDVPGWVLITVMTAGLVAALWAVAGPQLSSMLRDALSSVRG